MTIEPVCDMQIIKNIITNPEIWKLATEGDVDPESYQPLFDNQCCWLVAIDNNEIAGLIFIHNDNAKSIKFHPYLLPKFKGNGVKFIKSFLTWSVINLQKIEKVIITLPACYKRQFKLAKSIGFIEEGINRLSYFKDGVMIDQYNLGLTREEIKGVIKWDL